MKQHLWVRAGFVVVMLVGFWLRVADLNTMPPGLHFDEGENLERSWRVVNGYGLLPYFDTIPEPFDAVARGGFLHFTGVSIFNARLYAAFLSLLGAAATIGAARVLLWRHSQRELIALTTGMTMATLPPLVMIGRDIYAANWIPATTMLALSAVMWAWRTNKRRYFVLTGFFTGLAMTFYLVGLAFPAALIVIVVYLGVFRHLRWPHWRSLTVLVVSALVTLIPWFYLSIRIPNWIAPRIEALTIDNFNPLADVDTLLRQVKLALQPIFIPDTSFFPVYTPYTTAFLNPALQILFVIGVLAAVWQWKKAEGMAALIVGAVMIGPNILSKEPDIAIRMSGIFGPLAILTGLGAGELMVWCQRQAALKRLAPAALGFILIGCPLYSHYHVWYHFHEQPRTVADPTSVYSWAYYYHEGYYDLLKMIANSKQPLYVPVDQLNTGTAVVMLRSRAFMTVAPYDGRALPDGNLIHPDKQVTYGFPETEHIPLQYALLLPESRTILILPPLTPAKAEQLERTVQAKGDNLVTSQGWNVGKRLTLRAADNPFNPVSFTSGEPLAVFENNLELLAIDAPPTLQPGAWQPVTLYWRLRERTTQDYFARVQVWDYQDESHGGQNDHDGLILHYLYPTVMWKAGEVVSETRWVQVYGDAAAGGYRFAISAAVYPGPKSVTVEVGTGKAEMKKQWALVGHSAIPPNSFKTEAPSPDNIQAEIGDSIRLTGAQFRPRLAEAKPDGEITAQLYWQVEQPVGESFTLFIHIFDIRGELVGQQDMLPFDGRYPTWAWTPGITLMTTHTIKLDADSVGPYTFTVGMYRQLTLERLTVVQNGVPQVDRLVTIKP